ncbi:MAG: PEGA domain-containing protein [Proteobacteria bacterium]|nr:PEGA domain-containing protein [Pseudomonadota bacterium]
MHKIQLFCLVALLASCAFSNSKKVAVTISSSPQTADIYIDGVKYSANTPSIITLDPVRDYHIALVKEGYQDFYFIIEKKSYKRCPIGKALVFPSLFGSLSKSYVLRCNGFDSNYYDVDLVKRDESKVLSNRKKSSAGLSKKGAYSYYPYRNRNYNYRKEEMDYYKNSQEEGEQKYIINPRVPGYNKEFSRHWW